MIHSSELVWDAITQSAKRRFDFAEFEESFSEINSRIPDNFLFQIIIGFASGKDKKQISAEVWNELLILGLVCPREQIDQFVEDKNELLKVEIYAANLASTMLSNGDDPSIVLMSISQLLN